MASNSKEDEQKVKEDTPDEVTLDPHLIRYMQTAVALAIIRSKPSGQSAQEYAEELCIQYRTRQLGWKQLAEKLQGEVTLWKQRAMEARWSGESSVPSEKAGASTATPQSDPIVYPTPPCSEEPLEPSTSQKSDEPRIPPLHSSFLHSVRTLSTISTRETLRNPCHSQSDSSLDPTAQDSIQSALITLGEIVTTPVKPGTLKVTQKMMCTMVQVLLNLVDNRRFSGQFLDFSCDKVLCFTWGVISAILTNKALQDTDLDQLSKLINLLSVSPILRPAILQMLMKHVLQVADHLRHSKTVDESLSSGILQKSFHIFRSMETLLEQDSLRQDRCLSFAVCQQVFGQLENSLLHIWKKFPPFAQYVWHLENLLRVLHSSLDPSPTAKSKIS